MKVIIIKDCKEGKINQVLEVSDGYAKNFLIRQGFALPYNNKTAYGLSSNLKNLENKNQARLDAANALKNKIESLKLSFILKTSNFVVHGSITRKQILQELLKKGIKLDAHKLPAIQISSIGTTNIKVKIDSGVEAILKVEVLANGK